MRLYLRGRGSSRATRGIRWWKAVSKQATCGMSGAQRATASIMAISTGMWSGSKGLMAGPVSPSSISSVTFWVRCVTWTAVDYAMPYCCDRRQSQPLMQPIEQKSEVIAVGLYRDFLSPSVRQIVQRERGLR